MKISKKLIMLFVIGLGLVVSACTNSGADSSERIVSPRNQSVPVKGTWEVSEVLIDGSSNEENKVEWLGKEVQFSEFHMAIGESILENPQYQMKRVSGEQYLLFNSKSLPVDFVFSNKEVEVITVMVRDNFYCEILIIKEDKLILKIQGNSLYLNKISDETDEDVSSENSIKGDQNANIQGDKKTTGHTGVLIGLRSPDKDEGGNLTGKYNYRTLWISLINNKISPVLETENIFFPRRSGFWKIQIKNAFDTDREEEYILAYNVLMEDKKAEIQLKNKIMGVDLSTEDKENEEDEENITQEIDFLKWGERFGKIKRRLDYVGNDYISVETLGKGGYISGDETWEKSKRQLLPIDGLPSEQGVEIFDILNEPGVISMKSSWEKAIDYLGIDNSDILYRDEMLENFGLERKLGHWFIEGRINYIKNEEFNTFDYNINLIPSSKIVVYDTLQVPWTNIKDRVPRTLDAYTSPNRDITIVFTKNELLIYDIYGNGLSTHPRERLKLKEGEIPIMTEWAMGHYVESWENTFKTVMEN